MAVPSPVRLRLWLRRDRVEAKRRRRGEGQDEGEPKHHLIGWMNLFEHPPSPRPSPQGEGESFSVSLKIRATFSRRKWKFTDQPMVHVKNLRFAIYDLRWVYGLDGKSGFRSKANGSRVRASRARPGLRHLAGGDQKPAAGSGVGGGETRTDSFWREQGAGGEGKNAFVPRQFALAHDWPFAVQQVPRRGRAFQNDSECGQPVARAGNQQTRGAGGQDDAGSD